jgi:hypothetical protein
MRNRLCVLCVALVWVAAASIDEAGAQWNPHRQFSNAQQKCAAARTALDKDECQYLAEMLIEDLGSCARRSGPQTGQCASMLPAAREMLATVNRDPVLLDHRARQRAQQGQPNVGPQGFVGTPSPGRVCAPVEGRWYCH